MATRQEQRSHASTYNESEDGITSETTPLLADSSSPVVAAGDPGAAKAVTSTPSTSSAPTPTPTPTPTSRAFPKTQILLLCYARLIEPIAFFSIFPYINEMVLRNGHGSIAESDMGFYSGLIESLFSLTQMLVMIAWGRAADRLGRKPVLVFSLLGVAVATSLFGMARTIWQMVLFRCASGVFAGSIVTVRAMISENAGREHQAVAFSWFAVAGNLGLFIGPLVGGALADPARLYPRVFKGVWFFEEFPYALSSLVIGAVGLTAVLTSALFIKETMPREGTRPDDDEAGAQVPRHHASTRDLLKTPGVGIVLYNYGHAMLLAFAYTAIVPVFWATRVDLGGLGFSPLQISLFMGLTGLSQAAWLLLVFPPLQRRLGTNGVMRLCGAAYPFFLGFMPFLNLVLRGRTDASNVAFWVLAPTLLSLGPGVSMAFTGVQLALNDVSPSHETLGMLNALALTLTSGLRSFSPALFASLFAVGARNQFFYGYFVWVILLILGLGFTVSTRLLPETSEKQAENGDRYEVEGDDDSDMTVSG
ncbi:major facilitator superfamily transporter [Xylaria cf. heliscus]|nr:major facilitator superfamily transporter [Xylaria cf. heliscus]